MKNNSKREILQKFCSLMFSIFISTAVEFGIIYVCYMQQQLLYWVIGIISLILAILTTLKIIMDLLDSDKEKDVIKRLMEGK